MERIADGRKLLEAGPWGDWLKQDTDQRKKVPPPPLQKPYPADAKLIDFHFCFGPHRGCVKSLKKGPQPVVPCHRAVHGIPLRSTWW